MMLWNDLETFIQPMVEGTLASIASRGEVLQAVAPVASSLHEFLVR